MKLTTLAPSGALAPFVRTFEVVEAREEITRTLLPETGLILGIRFGGTATLLHDGPAALQVPTSVVTGLRTSARRMHTSAGGGIVLAKFHPAGAAAFFDLPLHELFGATRSLDEWVARSEVDRIESRIAESEDHAARIAAFETFLLAQRRRRAADPVVLAAVREIQAAPESIRVGALAARLGLSQDALEKRFRRTIGGSPKQFASVLRLRRAVASYRPGESLAQLSLEAGYYDQSHFIRHFRATTGAAPGRFLEREEYC